MSSIGYDMPSDEGVSSVTVSGFYRKGRDLIAPIGTVFPKVCLVTGAEGDQLLPFETKHGSTSLAIVFLAPEIASQMKTGKALQIKMLLSMIVVFAVCMAFRWYFIAAGSVAVFALLAAVVQFRTVKAFSWQPGASARGFTVVIRNLDREIIDRVLKLSESLPPR